jgi:two-component system chemotaxis response regulator CheB
LFRSAARIVPMAAVGVILTGMGKDGAEGLLELRHAGGTTFGQDEDSSLIYGMPRVAFERGAVERQYALGHMADAILDACEGDALHDGSRIGDAA